MRWTGSIWFQQILWPPHDDCSGGMCVGVLCSSWLYLSRSQDLWCSLAFSAGCHMLAEHCTVFEVHQPLSTSVSLLLSQMLISHYTCLNLSLPRAETAQNIKTWTLQENSTWTLWNRIVVSGTWYQVLSVIRWGLHGPDYIPQMNNRKSREFRDPANSELFVMFL